MGRTFFLHGFFSTPGEVRTGFYEGTREKKKIGKKPGNDDRKTR
jgi:hypothetical protein